MSSQQFRSSSSTCSLYTHQEASSVHHNFVFLFFFVLKRSLIVDVYNNWLFLLVFFCCRGGGHETRKPSPDVLSANDQSAPVTDRPISHVCARVTQTVFSFFPRTRSFSFCSRLLRPLVVNAFKVK